MALEPEKGTIMTTRKFVLDTLYGNVEPPARAPVRQVRATAAPDPLRQIYRIVEHTQRQLAAVRAQLGTPAAAAPPTTPRVALPRYLTFGAGGSVHLAVQTLLRLPDADINRILNSSP